MRTFNLVDIPNQPQGDEGYWDTVARALTTPESTGTFDGSQLDPSRDYRRVSIDEVMLLVAEERIPFVQEFGRIEEAINYTHEWGEQYLPDDETDFGFVTEYADPDDSVPDIPNRFSNLMARQAKSVSITEEAQIIARARGQLFIGTDELANQLDYKTRKLVRAQERATIESWQRSGSSTQARQFRGLLGQYRSGTENGWLGGVITETNLNLGTKELVAKDSDVSNASTQVSVSQLFNKWMLQRYDLKAGPNPNKVYVPPRALLTLQKSAFERLQINMTEQELARMSRMNMGGKVGIFYSDFGVLEIEAHPYLFLSNSASGTGDNAPAVSRFLFLHTPSIKYVDYKGFGGYHIDPRPVDGPVEERVISQYLTLKVKNLKSQGYAKGFWCAAN